jgi:hypothetical protein
VQLETKVIQVPLVLMEQMEMMEPLVLQVTKEYRVFRESKEKLVILELQVLMVPKESKV